MPIYVAHRLKRMGGGVSPEYYYHLLHIFTQFQLHGLYISLLSTYLIDYAFESVVCMVLYGDHVNLKFLVLYTHFTKFTKNPPYGIIFETFHQSAFFI